MPKTLESDGYGDWNGEKTINIFRNQLNLPLSSPDVNSLSHITSVKVLNFGLPSVFSCVTG